MMKLFTKLFIGLALGLLIGLYGPPWCVRMLLTIKQLIGQLISFTIPFIILFFVTFGITNLPTNSHRLLLTTLLLAYSSTILAGFLSLCAGLTLLPQFDFIQASMFEEVSAHQLQPFIQLKITPFFEVVSTLIAAFIFGLGIVKTQALSLKKIVSEGKNIVELLLARVIVPLLPFYIAGVTSEMAQQGNILSLLESFGVVMLLAVSLQWLWLCAIYLLTGLALKRNPIVLLRNMLPAYFTALGTMSSAATIPVEIATVQKNGVRNSIVHFTVPLCANIHLCGSTITLTLCTLVVASMTQGANMISLQSMIPFVLALGVVMIAAPGAPGGGVMSALGLLTSMMGFGDTAIALMIALYITQDGFGTACNVTCDGALSLWVDRLTPTTS